MSKTKKGVQSALKSDLVQIEATINASEAPDSVKDLLKEVTSWGHGVIAELDVTSKLKAKVDELESAIELLEGQDEGISPEVATTLKASYAQALMVFRSINSLLGSELNPLDEMATRRFLELIMKANTAVVASIGLVDELVFEVGDEGEAEESEDDSEDDDEGDDDLEAENV